MKTNTEKRTWVDKALSRKGISHDEPFVSQMRHQASSDKNLNAVIKDIGAYRASSIGIQRQHEKWASVRIKAWSNPLFITFTPRYELTSDNLVYRFQSCINTISKRIYKNAYKRRGRRINHHSYIEGNNLDTRIHIHSVIETPAGRDIKEFKSMILGCWWNTGSVDIDNKSYYTDKDLDDIAGYITKIRTKCYDNGMSLQDSFIP